MNKQKFIIINFLKSYINLNEYNNQIIEINYDIIFNKCEDHNETHYFSVLIVDLNDEIFQHFINESTIRYIYAFNDSLYLSTIYTFYIKDRSEFDSCIEREEFINYLKMLYRRKYEQ